MFLLACEVEIVNNACSTGFKSVLITDLVSDQLTLAEFYELAPYTLALLVTAAVFRTLFFK